MDHWLRSALHTLVRDVTNALETMMYWAPPVRSRRLWTSFPTGICAVHAAVSGRANRMHDKQAAYATLYEALVTFSKLLAPTMPFLAEELYQNLVRTMDEEHPALCPPGRLAGV